MARRNDRKFAKERKERARAERAAKKRARKAARSGPDYEDPDLAGIVVGPQPKDKATDAEVMAAVQRAMNPASRGVCRA